MRCLDCADAQADLRHCSHTIQAVFIPTRFKLMSAAKNKENECRFYGQYSTILQQCRAASHHVKTGRDTLVVSVYCTSTGRVKSQ